MHPRVIRISRPLILGGVRRLGTSVPKQAAVAWQDAKPFSEIPHLTMLPYIGTAWAFLPIVGRYKINRVTDSFTDKRRRLGDIFRDKTGSFNAVFCFLPEDLETMVKHEGKYPKRAEIATIKAYRESRKDWYKSGGLMIVNGKEWADLRSKVQKHILKPRVVYNYLEPIQEVAKEFVQRVRDLKTKNNEVPDFYTLLHKWSLESVALVGLDTRFGCLREKPTEDGIKVMNAVLTVFECIQKLEIVMGNLPYWKFFPTPTWRKFVSSFDVYTEISFDYIRRASKREVSEDSPPTVLQSMLAEKNLDVAEAMVFTADMLLAGVETTATSVGFLLYHLARNPDKQEKLHQSIVELLPTPDTLITPKIYDELAYVRGCIKEQQRLSPLVPGSGREIAHDCVLSGYQVPAGTVVFVSSLEMMLDDKYFPDAHRFLPERWLDGKRAEPFTFVPFGFGTRSCIGRRLAELEIISLVAEIVRNFKIEYHYEDIGMLTKMICVPDKPLRFNFIER